jgi:hypothetical protein
MNLKRPVFAILVGGVVLSVVSVCAAIIDVKQIEEVVKKPVLSPADLQAIDSFMADAVEDLIAAVDFTEVSKARATILRYQQGTQARYVTQYSESAYKHIALGLEAADNAQDMFRRVAIATNLLTLIDALEDPRLLDLALKEVPEKSPPVRYWAVKACTDPELWAKITRGQGNAAQLAGQVIDQFSQVVGSSTPEVLERMSDFAGRFSSPAADDLLAQIAQTRITQYADWTVTYELADVTILKQLCERIAAGGSERAKLAKCFAQLYSYAIQRYIKGTRLGVLRDPSKDYLGSVLIEVNDKCLPKLLGTSSGMIRQAVEANDPSALEALQNEHDRLLGSADKAGLLPAKYDFTYGAKGQNLQAPLPLGDPPQTTAAPEQ